MMACALGFVERGVSYCICEQVRGGKKGGREGRLTDAMKSPNAPPSAKPITPETTVFPGQDSMSICI